LEDVDDDDLGEHGEQKDSSGDVDPKNIYDD